MPSVFLDQARHATVRILLSEGWNCEQSANTNQAAKKIFKAEMKHAFLQYECAFKKQLLSLQLVFLSGKKSSAIVARISCSR
jgi:hypothetical protein